MWLVVLGRVELQFSEEFAVRGEDADVSIVDQDEVSVPAWRRPIPMWWRRLLCRRVITPLGSILSWRTR